MNPCSPVLTWSTARIAPARRFDGFRDVVSATHLPWDIPVRRARADYRARLRARPGGDMQVIECECEPCAGRRGAHEIAGSDEAWFGVLHVVAGRERLRQDGSEAYVGAGDLVLWDSTRPIDFVIGRPLHKITLLMPQRLVESVVPDIHDRVCRPVSGATGAGAVFAGHLRSLAAMSGTFTPAQRPRVLSATLDLLALLWGEPRERRDAGDPLAQVRSRALARLGDPSLTIAALAREAGMSLRQLHRLFEDTGTTPARWLWAQRLERCRADIAARPGTGVSEIAFRWGFSDAAHFSRAFRLRFGCSPREWRQRSCAPMRDSGERSGN